MCISDVQDSTGRHGSRFGRLAALRYPGVECAWAVTSSVDKRWTTVDTFFLDGREMLRVRFRATTTFGVAG
jgi:hypothetical protein